MLAWAEAFLRKANTWGTSLSVPNELRQLFDTLRRGLST